MTLFDVSGVILIAVDDFFTLDDKDGIAVNKGSIHRQFLDKYYTKNNVHKDIIAKIVDERNGATEITVTIGDKYFVLFAYSSQGKQENYSTYMDYRRGFVEIGGSLEKALRYCKEHFPGKTVYTALIGTGVQNDRQGRLPYTECDAEARLHKLAKSVGIAIEVVKAN